MKRSLLYIGFFLLPLFALAQAPPQFTTTIGRTPCGGNITVNWNADVSILRDYWAILLKNNREQARQAFDPTQKKATFTGLSNGAYKVKVQKKTGEVGYGGTSNRISITGTYNGFQVDKSQTAATEVAAGRECGASGKITIKIKNGVGPFVLKAYEVGQTTPAVTSAVTNKSGNETPVELSGLKPNTTYQIEVTDQVGNAGCSRTEPKSNLSYTTKAAAGSFLATDPQIEVCQPAASGITPEGSLTVRLDNANGTGPFTVQLVNKDTNEVIIASRVVVKGAGTTTTARLTPESGKKIEANKTYKVIVRDNGANCTATRELGPIVKTYRPKQLLAHLAPSCSSTDCRTFDIIIGGYIEGDDIESRIYSGKYTITVQPTSGPSWTRTFTNQQALPENRSPGTAAKIYGNREVRYWITTSPKLFSLSETVSSGDVVTIKYEDCSGNADISQTFTVGQPVLPTSRIEAKPVAGTCSVKVSIATNFQHASTIGNMHLSYATLCKTEGIQSRIGVSSGGSYTYTAGGAATGLFRFYDQIDFNLDKLETTTVASNYVVEYAVQGASFGGVYNCRYYKSQTFPRTSLPSTGLNRIPVGSGYTMLLNAPNTGGVIAIGANLSEQSGVADYITDSNHLHVTVRPIMGTPSHVTVNATGPWNLQGTYTITFPKTFEFYPSMNRGQNVLYHITDVPPGNYSVTLKDNCGTRVIPHVVVGNGPATHVLNMERTVGCVSGVSKGKVKFSASYTPPNRNVSFARMHVFKYVENTAQKLHEHVGERVDSKDLTYIPNPDPDKEIREGEIGGLDPGKYILGIEVGDFYFWYSVIDNPNANGYLYGYEVSRRNRKKLGDTMIYKEFTIEEYNEVDPTVSIGICDPADPNTGFVRVELPDGSEPQYPITYTLYKVSGGNKTVAVDANGSPIAPVTVAVKPAALRDAFATFNNVPKLTGGDSYEVKFESGCLDREVQVPDFGALVAPQVSADRTAACASEPLTLSVDLSEAVYDIQWKSNPANALDGVAGADLRKNTVTFNPTMGAKYFVTYTLKTGMGCGSPTARNTAEKEIPLKQTNFTDAAIGALPDVSETMPTNQCAATATWTAPTITDTEGCGYRLTWEVTKADGSKYTPTPDTDGNTPATTYNGFQIGDNYVEYTVKGKADGGTEGKKRFKVTILAPHVNVKVESAFVAASSSSSPAITTVTKGSTIFYKVTLTNQTTQALGGGTVRITLPNNTNGNYELPAVTDPGILTTGLGTSVNVQYDTNDPRVLILSNVSGGGTLSQGRKAEAYIPIKIKDNADCSLYENACQATLTAKASFEYSTGNGCAASGVANGDGVSAEIDNSGSHCMRMELFCGSAINLTARGTGYTSYKWYDGGATGASYSPMSSTTATQQVSAAGYYKVEKIVDCDGVATTTTEYIRVIDRSAATVDPIRDQTGNIGGTCTNTGDSSRDGRWVSHIYLCAGTGKTLRANFYQGGVAWQKANGCDPDINKPNCYDDRDSCWTTISTDYTFEANSAGRYRLKVGSGPCTKTYFFEVISTGLTARLEGQVTEHSALSLGAANLILSAEGILYKYTVKRVSDGAILATDVTPAVDSRGSQYIKVPNLAVPNNLNSDQFEITVTPRSGLNGCQAKITVTIPKTEAMTARVEFTNTWSNNKCNESLYKFTVVGGRRNYRYLIYKINGEYAKRSYNGVLLDLIPDSEYSAPVVPLNAANDPPDKFDAWIEVPQEGKYIFLIKDQDDRVALTNEVMVGQTSKFAVEVEATALTCATENAGKITAKFLDPTAPHPKIQLFKYKTDGTEDTGFPTYTNASGEFNNLAAGKYRVELSYLHSGAGNIRCVVKRDVEVTAPDPIEASIGIVKDNSCTNNGKFLVKVNWVRGGRPGYSFMSTSGSGGYATDREFYVDGGSEADPEILVYVKDANGCIAEFKVMAKKALVKPTLTATPVTYDCGGNGSFTVTPTTPSGKTYTYEYSLDGGARQTPNAGDGISYTGLVGKATPYVVRAYYKEPSTHPINELYNATFGDIERVDDLAAGEGAPTGITSAKATEILTSGTYLLTKQLPSSAVYRSETGTGRYYAIHAGAGNTILYDKQIDNVVKLRTMTVKFKYINLGKNHLSAYSVPLKVTLEVENPSGGGSSRFSKTLPAATQAEGWKEGEVTFDELIGFNQKTKVRLIIESMVSNAVMGFDNIKVTQPTETCQEGEPISVQVVPNRGFSAVVTQVEPPKCHAGKGKIYVKLNNMKAGNTYTYQLSGGAFTPTAVVGTDKLEIEAPVGVHTLNIRMVDTDGTYCQVATDGATIVDIPQMEIEDLTINPKGCVAPYLTAGAIVKVIHGQSPYTLQGKRPSDADFVDITTADWTGNVGDITGLDENMSYLFRVRDDNGCLSPVVSRYVPAKIEVTATANGTLCLTPSGTGTILVEALTGNGGYEFEIDGNGNWVSDPANPTEYEFDGLAPRATPYMIQVRDRLGCSLATPIPISINDALEVGLTSDNQYNCDSNAEEHIELKVQGGEKISGGYRVEWKRGGQASDPSGYNPTTDNDGGNVAFGTPNVGTVITYGVTIKTPGVYHFRITDAKGCEQLTSEEVVAEIPAFIASPGLKGSEINCAGSSDGVIGVFNGSVYLPIETAIDRTKGVAPYTITIYKQNGSNWDDTHNTNGQGLAAGTYRVELKDAKNCSTYVDVPITEKPAPTLTVSDKKDVRCDASGSKLGEVRLTFSNSLSSDYRLGLYTSLDANGNPVGLARMYPGGSSTAAKEDFPNQTSGTFLFENLFEGDYYPAVVNLSTGCAVVGTQIRIDGTDLKVKYAGQTTVDCNTDKIKLEIREDGTAIDENQLQVAIYDASLAHGAQNWLPTASYVVTGTGTNKRVTVEIDVQAGIDYQIATKYKGCTAVRKAESQPVLAPPITQNRKPNLCGANVNLDYTVTGLTGVNGIEWELYPYPLDIAHLPLAGRIDHGTATVNVGKARIQGAVTGLQDGLRYVLVVKHNSAHPTKANCIIGSKDFTVSKSAQPLAMVDVELIKNSSCNTPANPNYSAQVRIKVKDGQPPYRYTITTDPNEPVDHWAEAEVVTTNSRELVLDKTFETTDKKITVVTPSPPGQQTWYVHVRDANDCYVTQQVDIKEDKTPHIDSVAIENLCVPGTEYTVKVKMSQIGRGQHYYTFKKAGGVESAKQPMPIVEESPGVYVGRIFKIYADTDPREIRVYDQNVCPSDNTANLTFSGKPSFALEVSKPITCRAGAAGDGEIKVDNIDHTDPSHNYIYRLLRETTSGDVVALNDTPMASGTTTLTVPVSEAGKYRFEIVDLDFPDCPFSRTVTVREKVLPILTLQNYVDSKCFNPNVELGEVDGGGMATFLASPQTQTPMKFTVTGARYADDNTTVSLDAASMTPYRGVTASNGKITIDPSGRKITVKGLYGHVRGVIYTIEVEGQNECKATTEVTIYGVKEIKADMDQSEVTQFKCSADQEMVAKLKLPITAITGGSGVYRFTLLKGSTPVTGNIDLLTPEFSIDDQAGGAYTLRVEDAQYTCAVRDFPFPVGKEIDPFVKVKNVTATEAQDITCNAGEKVTVTATLDPVPTKDVRISLSLRNAANGSHQSQIVTATASTASVSHTFDNVPMGNYAVVATNEETGCVVYGESYKVQDPNTFSLTATLEKPVKCYGDNNGEITFTLADLDLSNSGGVDQAAQGFDVTIKGITDPSYNQTVNAPVGQTTVRFTALPYGAYTAEAKSTSTGCVTKIPANFTIRQADQPIAVAAKLKVPDDCSATGSGEISVEVVGGVAPYKITITGDNGHTQTAEEVYNRWLFTAVPGANAPGASFDIRVEDTWGCDKTFTQVVKDVVKPDPIDYDPPVIPMVSCKGVEDAYIKIENARGGAYDDPTAAQPKTTYYYELYHSERGAIRPLQVSNEFFDLPAGNYTLVVRDRWNCTKEQQFTIANPPEIKVTKVDASALVCYGELGHVKVNVVGGTPTGTPSELVYTLDLVDIDKDAVVKTYPDVRASMLPYTINGLTPGVNYRVRATDGKQCPGASDKFVLTAAPNLEVRASYEDSCTDNAYEGNVVITFDDATVDYSKMQYSFDGGTSRYAFATGSGQGAQVRINRNHVSVKPTSLPQTIKLYYSDAATTCEGETNPVIVPVVEKLSLIQDPTTPPGLNELRLLGKNGVPDYVFYFNGVHKGNEGTYMVRIQDPEGVDPSDNKLKKRIEAKVEDSKGCTAEQVFYVDYVDIDIPRFFTPNGDGENDTWSPRNTQQYPNILTQIYDRYGRLLKELSRAETWDGTYNGKALPTGDYWYIITLGEEDDSREFKGHFTLFR
ncbi:T9SS type B sorting domain-containing protein [Capnocytophaga granulosa]|uniref:T9SS type B sorting domain-containing protein n=1 Tax=Capnocytophaga granulosa TaxID=45242 RepID=UPI0038572575